MPRQRLSPDTRFQPVVDFYFAEFERRHGVKPLWDGSDGQALGRILFAQKQLSAEKLKDLLKAAFEWCDAWWGPIRKGDFCPLQPGFRFREFCAHFGRVVCRMPDAHGTAVPPRVRADAEHRVPTAREVHRIFREYRDRFRGSQDAKAKLDAVLRRELGIGYDQAAAIINQQPMRPDRTGD